MNFAALCPELLIYVHLVSWFHVFHSVLSKACPPPRQAQIESLLDCFRLTRLIIYLPNYFTLRGISLLGFLSFFVIIQTCTYLYSSDHCSITKVTNKQIYGSKLY